MSKEKQHTTKRRRRALPRKVFTIEQAIAIQSYAIQAAYETLIGYEESNDPAGVIKASHAVTQANQALTAMLEKNDIRKEIENLRKEVTDLTRGYVQGSDLNVLRPGSDNA